MENLDNKDAELSEPITIGHNPQDPRTSCADIKMDHGDTELSEADAARHDTLHEQNTTPGTSDPLPTVTHCYKSSVCSIL